MKFGLDVPTTGIYADVRAQTTLAVEAEAAGWDGFFVWDVPSGIDPWLALTAIALQTSTHQNRLADPTSSSASPLVGCETVGRS